MPHSVNEAFLGKAMKFEVKGPKEVMSYPPGGWDTKKFFILIIQHKNDIKLNHVPQGKTCE